MVFFFFFQLLAHVPRVWIYFLPPPAGRHQALISIAKNGQLWREARGASGLPRPHVQNVHAGDFIVAASDALVPGWYRPLAIFEVQAPDQDGISGFAAMVRFSQETREKFVDLGLTPDVVEERFCGYFVTICDPKKHPIEWTCGPYKRPARSTMVPFNAMDLIYANTQLNKVEAPAQFGRERFLGVKVGASNTRRTLEYCALESTGGAAVIVEQDAMTLEKFLSTALPQLLEKYDFSSIAISGPLTPEDRVSGLKSRLHERVLMQSGIPGVARPLALGSRNLQPVREAAFKIKQICENANYHYSVPSKMAAQQHGALIEVFTRAWVATWFEPENLPEQVAYDSLVKSHFCEQGQNPRVLGELESHGLLPQSAGVQDLTPGSAEALILALAAGLHFFGRSSVLGVDDEGSFVLPMSDLWGEGWRPLLQSNVTRLDHESKGSLLFCDVPRPPIPKCEWICFADPTCTNLALESNVLPIFEDSAGNCSESIGAWKQVAAGQSVLLVETSPEGACRAKAVLLVLPEEPKDETGPAFEMMETSQLSGLADELWETVPDTIPALHVHLWRDASCVALEIRRECKLQVDIVPWTDVDVLATTRFKKITPD